MRVDRIQQLVAAAGGSDDAIGVGGPGEGFWAVVVFGRISVDRRLQADERIKDAAFEPAAGEFGKEPLDRVEPGRRSRGEEKGPARMAGEPCSDFGVLVAAVIIEDHMDQPAGRDVALEAVQKTQEFLVPMALHALADDAPVEQVEGSKQGGRAPGLRRGRLLRI